MSPITGYIGAQRTSAQISFTGLDWSTVAGAFPGGDGCPYVARNDGSLARLPRTRGTITTLGKAAGTVTVLSGPGIDGATWAARAMLLRTGTVLPTAPTASINPTSCDGIPCTFTGDTIGRAPFTFVWNLGDATTSVTTVAGNGNSTGSGGTAHTYATAGTRAVRLTVIDAAGQVVSTAVSLTVVNSAPTALCTVSCAGRFCSFDGTGSSDDGPGH